jgi:hypothetical protein
VEEAVSLLKVKKKKREPEKEDKKNVSVIKALKAN